MDLLNIKLPSVLSEDLKTTEINVCSSGTLRHLWMQPRYLSLDCGLIWDGRHGFDSELGGNEFFAPLRPDQLGCPPRLLHNRWRGIFLPATRVHRGKRYQLISKLLSKKKTNMTIEQLRFLWPLLSITRTDSCEYLAWPVLRHKTTKPERIWGGDM
jgi:hypothetical protein